MRKTAVMKCNDEKEKKDRHDQFLSINLPNIEISFIRYVNERTLSRPRC